MIVSLWMTMTWTQNSRGSESFIQWKEMVLYTFQGTVFPYTVILIMWAISCRHINISSKLLNVLLWGDHTLFTHLSASRRLLSCRGLLCHLLPSRSGGHKPLCAAMCFSVLPCASAGASHSLQITPSHLFPHLLVWIIIFNFLELKISVRYCCLMSDDFQFWNLIYKTI